MAVSTLAKKAIMNVVVLFVHPCFRCGRERHVTLVRNQLVCGECRQAGLVPLPSVKGIRHREVVVSHDGEVLRFCSKVEARRVMRIRLRRKRLPSEVVDQIEGR